MWHLEYDERLLFGVSTFTDPMPAGRDRRRRMIPRRHAKLVDESVAEPLSVNF